MKKVMFFALMSSMFVFASCFTGNDKGNESQNKNDVVLTDTATANPEGDSVAANAEMPDASKADAAALDADKAETTPAETPAEKK